MAEALRNEVVLSKDEIFEITHRKRPKEQLLELAAMGVPAHHRRHDNTVCVLRADVTARRAEGTRPPAGPQRKSAKQ